MSVNFDELKKAGFLKQRQKDTCIARFRSIAGNLTSDQLRKLADLADEYGRGYVHITTRQGAEIPWVDISDCPKMNHEIRAKGLPTGASGPRIRTVAACPGSEVCRFGLMNTRATAVELDRQFFGRPAAIKTKMAVTGCPNSCAKPQENDIGLMGVVQPVLEAEKCVGCGLCRKSCPNGAVSIVEGRPVINKADCLLCGRCIAACPAEALAVKRRGYQLYAGGKIGRKPRLGRVVAKFIPENEVAAAIEQVLAAFAILSEPGERIGDTLARVGVHAFKTEMAIRKIESGSGGEYGSKPGSKPGSNAGAEAAGEAG